MLRINIFFSLFLFLIGFSTSTVANSEYIGDSSCKSCHAEEYQQWQGSHHDLAMQTVNDKTVLGDFKNAIFKKDDITTLFFKKDNRFMVNTEGPDGKLYDYEVSYTFGVYPLQQYMVKFPKGKIQVLDIAWDSRPKEAGGQRWFSLHPDEIIKSDDVLHWTGPNLNWNYMCADCHSTNLKKNYNVNTASYKTEWSSINVSCEACHGPGSNHNEWAQLPEKNTSLKNKGLTINLSDSINQWSFNTKTGKPELKSNINRNEVDMCAKCHSRRSQLDDDFIPGDNFRDHYQPALLHSELYHPDGKINDEVYVYGSFKQSLMYKSGVTCHDCHNSHSLKLKADGDAVCMQCHQSASYATAKHHYHKADSEGSQCVACHMPSKTYMGVDVRNDHSFRIPRPDLSQKLSTPNACNNCHQDKNSQWASDAIKKWYGTTPVGYQQFASALHGLDVQSEDALNLTYQQLINDTPDIAKATAVGYLGQYPSRQTLMTSVQMLRSEDADIRRQALYALESFPIQHTLRQIFPMLNDPIKIVRLEAARILASVPKGSMDNEQKVLLESVTEEYRQSLLFSAERPESQLALAQLYQYLSQPEQANTAFKEALSLQPQYVPAYVNYANFLRQYTNERAAYNLLKKGLNIINDAPALHHALGLWYIRNKEKNNAMDSLRRAAELSPDNARYQYVYAVGIAEDNIKKAVEILENARMKHTGNLEVLSALVNYYKQLGEIEKSQQISRKMSQAFKVTIQ